ncbi:MAG: CocE/NonD family hydrolase [Myxococcota bacterium]
MRLLLGLVVLWGMGCAAGRSVTVRSVGVPMEDGVRLAVDVILPSETEGARVPAVLLQTRYWRSFALRIPDPKGQPPPAPREDIAQKLTDAGYAVVVADVRGTGASQGRWERPFSRQEVADSSALLDFIAAQPWSNGKVGTYGVSYEGSTALLTATHPHPALKAVLARQVEWDLLDELLAPGGVRNVTFPEDWGRAVAALDRNQYPDFFPQMFRWLIRGVRPLDDDSGGVTLSALVTARSVANVASDVATIRRPEDPFGVGGPPVASLCPAGHVDELRNTTAAVAIWGSWWDAATADAVLRAVDAMPIREAMIGPWNHEGTANASPFARGNSRDPTVALEDVVAYFDRHLKGSGSSTSRFRWFVGGAEAWDAGESWPRTREARLHLVDGGGLLGSSGALREILDVDFRASSGSTNRWVAGLLRPVDYGDRRQVRGTRAWSTAPSAEPVSIFGAPTWDCVVELDGPEAALHVYLDAVEADGSTRYVTEGVARVSSGVVTVRMRPVAVSLGTGARLRVAVAGADAGNFERVPAEAARRITFTSGGARGCSLGIPVR